jgi:hypothetical protein
MKSSRSGIEVMVEDCGQDDQLIQLAVQKTYGAELAPWRDRPLDQAFPYLILDARYEKARVDHWIVDVAVLRKYLRNRLSG